jgi:hypothetical protein
MKKKVNPLTALFVGAVFASGALVATSPALAQGKPQNSKVAGPVLKQAKAAVDSKKWADAIAKAKEVQAMSGKNAYDDYLANEMLYFAYARTNQYADAAKSIEKSLESEYLPKGEVPKRNRVLLSLNYQLKNYDKVIALGDKAAKEGWGDDEITTSIGQAYYLKGDYKNSAKYVEANVSSQLRAGKKPKEQTLILIQSSCMKTNDSPCLQRTYEQLVTYYPKTQYWQNLVDAMYHTQSGQDVNLLQVYRLAAAVDVLKKPSDFTEYAQLAIDAGSAGEAQSILEKGFEKKIFVEKRDIDRNTRLLDSAKKQVAADQAALAKRATDAAAAKEGEPDVTVGLAYMGYQQYDKAVEAINRGLTKPVQNAANARLLLGIAELRAGRKDEARKAFKQVKGDPTLERLANLWTLHSQA